MPIISLIELAATAIVFLKFDVNSGTTKAKEQGVKRNCAICYSGKNGKDCNYC